MNVFSYLFCLLANCSVWLNIDKYVCRTQQINLKTFLLTFALTNTDLTAMKAVFALFKTITSIIRFVFQ